MEKLNVAIADDNERMLNLLGEIVESDKDLKLVGKARNGFWQFISRQWIWFISSDRTTAAGYRNTAGLL